MIDQERSGESAPVVGRDAELARLGSFVRDASPGAALVLIGGPGIGKTTLWEAGIEAARASGARVLSARPGGSAAQLSFGGLIDLCDEFEEGDLAALPGPQRRGLEAALVRADTANETAPPMVIALGLLGVVRAMAAEGPVVIAIDDLHWLDPPSAEVLTFVARRVDEARVAFLLARRPERVGALEAVLARAAIERIRVGPLSLGAVRRLLFDRLGLTLSRHALRRIVDMTEGNPLFALEVGRSLLEIGGLPLEGELPLPDSLDEALVRRVAGLPAAVRRVLLAVALSEDPRIEQLLAVIDASALDDAVDEGAVVLDGVRVRASHSLLAAAAERHARATARRELHLALSAAAGDEQSRAMHLAFATPGPDDALAARVASAADKARSRGARPQAALLAAQALRLTPADAAERPARVLALAERLDDAGELRRMTVLLREELASLPPGPSVAHAWLMLSEGDDVRSRQDQDSYLERALAEVGDDGNLRGRVLAKMAGNAAAGAVAQLDQAEAWALKALEGADEPAVHRYALWSLAWTVALGGRPVAELCARSPIAADPSGYISASPERVAAQQLFWRGELASARESLDSLSVLADERGDPTSYAMIRMHRVELELRSGKLSVAQRLLDEWGESADYETQFRPQYPRCRALLEAGRGAADEARRWARETIELAEAAGTKWDELEARRALGIGALIESAPDQALAELWPVWEHCESERVLDRGAFPVAPELVEALVELKRFEDAQAVTSRVSELAEAQDQPWGRATAKRCNALVRLARDGYEETSAAALLEASVDLERLELRLDSARCLLALGRAQRRVKQWRGAREALERAIAAFGGLGADGWEQRATTELARVGGRRPADGDLTPSERRVVELAAQGLSNKEIASVLYVTVNTVEVHLARAYAKLGVRSRTQLAGRLASGP
ncbi:MAG: AAA family ATPase [Solirubrobacteraceae bacterium]